MTDNTQAELDEILEKYGEYYHLKQLNRFSDSEMQLNFAEETDIVRAKQALLDWHNKQVKNAVVTAEDNLDQYWNKELNKQIEGVLDRLEGKTKALPTWESTSMVDGFDVLSAIEAERNKLKDRDDAQL